MANEATIQSGLQINSGNLRHRSPRSSFRADVSGAKGPVPGAITISTSGTNIDLSQLTSPGLCQITNLDSTNFVTWGVWDATGFRFLPLGEILPGEWYVIRLSRHLSDEFTQTGTGTAGDTNALRLMADTAACNVKVEAFER